MRLRGEICAARYARRDMRGVVRRPRTLVQTRTGDEKRIERRLNTGVV